ncbi:MAG: FtsX-like permease family protein [Candidatus Thorarchaeota archaeon]
MKNNSFIPKGSRLIALRNAFILTRTFFRTLTKQDQTFQNKQERVFHILLIIFSPIIFVVVPIIDIFLLIFLPGLHLFRPLFKAGWKYGLISSIGVTLAVSIITQYVFFIYSYQFQAFGLFLAEEPRTYIQVEVEDLYIDSYLGTEQYWDFLSVSNIALYFGNVSHRILQTDCYFQRPTFIQTTDPTNNITYLPNMPLYGTLGKLATFISSNIAIGSVPENDFEVIALVTRDFYNHSSIRANNNITIYVPISLNLEDSLNVDEAATFNGTHKNIVNVTGIVFLDEIPNYDITGSEIDIPLEYILEFDSGAAILAYWPSANSILESIEYTQTRATIVADLFYNIDEIDSFDLQGEIDTLKFIGVNLKEMYLVRSDYQYVRINSYLVDLMEQFKDEYNLYQTFMFAFLSPIIVLTIILTVYAANLVRKKRDRQLTILAERGTNRREIGSYLALESLITGGISLMFGVFLGVPIASVLTKSSGFLMFSNQLLPLRLDVASVSVALIGSVGAIVLIQLFNTITLLKKRNIEDYGKVEKTLPVFYKYFLDIILIVFATTIWFVFKLPVLSAYQDLTAKYVGIPALIIMLFGLILFVQRLLPLFSKILVKLTSKLRMDITSMSIREIHRYQKSFARSSIILCLSFSLVISSIIVPYSYQDFNTQGAYYDLGADIVIRNFPVDNDYLRSKISNLTEVESISVVRFININDPAAGDLAITYSLLIVDPETYLKTAFFRDDFSEESVGTLFENLDDTFGVLAQVDELGVIERKVGQDWLITYAAYNDTWRTIPPFSAIRPLNLTLTIQGEYKYWPNLVNKIAVTNVRSLFYHLVVREEFLENIQVRPTNLIDYLYVKTNSSYNIEEVAEKIGLISEEGTVNNVENEIFVKPDSPRSSILYSAINSTLIMSFAINSIILALFASIQLIDRSKEIATMKAIGISTKQLMKYHLSIYISLLAFSTIFGMIIGYLASSMLMGVLTITRNIPPYSILFPAAQIVIVIAILVSAAAMGALIPTISSTKQEIGTELRHSA